MSNQKKIVNWISQKSLRLPNVAFTLCKPTAKLLRYDTECNVPGSHHMFIVPLDYNKIQITNYLQQLYNIQRPLSVHTEIKFGGSRPNPYRAGWKLHIKDVKYAYVKLRPEDAFVYPSLAEQRDLGSGQSNTAT